jgi:hypothetical protein
MPFEYSRAHGSMRAYVTFQMIAAFGFGQFRWSKCAQGAQLPARDFSLSTS